MVTLRAKKRATGNFHLYVDIYQNGQREKRYLKLYTSQDYTQPEIDKHGNVVFDSKGQPKARKLKPEDKTTWELATKIRTELENNINKGNYGFDSVLKSKTSFTTYFTKYVDNYNKKDVRKASGGLAKFNDFNDNKNVLCSAMNEDYAIAFKEYLESKLSSETASSYYRHFKVAVKKAHKDGLLKTNFADDVRIKTTPGLQKDILNMGEIQKLNNTPAGNNQVKRAFLFSCLTGLRFCDIINLKWKDIQDNDGGLMVSIIQSKTNKPVKINLNDDAIMFLGDRKANEELVYTLPSHTGVLKSLRTWAKKAEVNKKVTYHVARHSFATNLIFYGTDVKTTSTLLGHSSLDFTNLYVREVESLKQKAVNKLPTLSTVTSEINTKPLRLKRRQSKQMAK